MRVRVSGTKERRHSREITGMVHVRVRRPKEAAVKCHKAAIAPRMPGDKFRGQASALREATEKNALQRYAAIHGELYHRTHLCQGGGKPRLVFRDWCHERIGVPAMIRSLWGEISNALVIHLPGQAEYVLC